MIRDTLKLILFYLAAALAVASLGAGALGQEARPSDAPETFYEWYKSMKVAVLGPEEPPPPPPPGTYQIVTARQGPGAYVLDTRTGDVLFCMPSGCKQLSVRAHSEQDGSSEKQFTEKEYQEFLKEIEE